ncbi:Fructose-1,6-bisphosphatase/inositol-1-monophosphatase [uncultured archaeon]|nr:Fructose-1,6-bisphosphatase/inositol-1-monophosphatase [uncultured archaeon]
MSDYIKLFKKIGKTAKTTLEDLPDGAQITGKNPIGQKSIKADIALEKLVADFLREKTGGTLITEEAGKIDLGKGEDVFVLDPLDGSSNYSRGVPYYGLIIARSAGFTYNDITHAYVINLASGTEYFADEEGAFSGGKPLVPSPVTSLKDSVIEIDTFKNPRIYDTLRPLLKSVKDIRRIGASGVALAHVASGAHQIYLNPHNPISVVHAPGIYVAEKAGALFTDCRGNFINPKLDISVKIEFMVAANKEIQRQALSLMGVKTESEVA